ncbi:MAG TPA: exodeoxyribonuclease VII small subunit [Candidatus Saccharimonadia bacterium]
MTAKPFEFEKSLAELEAITTWFESSDADLDQGLAKFERGMELAQQLRQHLAEVENRVEKIRQKFTAAPALTEAEAAAPSPAADDGQAGLF